MGRPPPRSGMSASLKGFGCRPFAGALGLGAVLASESLVREETAGRKRRGLAWRELWGFWGSRRHRAWVAGVEGAGVIVRSEHDALFGGEDASGGVGAAAERGWGGRGRRVRAPARGWRRRRSRLRGGKRGDCHEVSIPIRGRRWRARGAHAFQGFDDDHPAAKQQGQRAPRRKCFGVTVLEVTVGLSGRAFGRGERLAEALDVAGLERLRQTGRSGECGGGRWAARAGESGG